MSMAGIGLVAVIGMVVWSGSLSAQHVGDHMAKPAEKPAAAASKCGNHDGDEAAAKCGKHGAGKCGKHAGALAAALKAIDAATELVKHGKQDAALVELAKARGLVAKCHKAMTAKHSPKFVNARCPLMGSTIKPEKVTEALTRTFKGETVAFCCGGCPGAWDKLSEADKAAKLAKSKGEAKTKPSGHSGHGAPSHD